MTRSVEIRIGGRPPTPNARRHWAVTAKDNERWKEAAREVAAAAIGPSFGPPMARAIVDVTFVVKDAHDRDWDNLIASTKPLTDGLVAAGVLADDSSQVIAEIRFPAIRHERGVQATIYRITEVDVPGLGLA